MNFYQRYSRLGNQFCVIDTPMMARANQSSRPKLLLWNDKLTIERNIPLEKSSAHSYLSGQLPLPGVDAVALAYSGHQFGHFNPTLGDGRAHLIGSFDDAQGQAYDLQIKGSGATPFSRGGDGLCALGPAVREFVMSQALGALNVPTTECLAVVTTGQQVYRNESLPGAVVCRVASSHIRVGSFQYLALQEDLVGLKALMELAIKRYFSDINEQGDKRIVAFLRAVCKQQVALIVHWLRVGFIHGVMNTDNTLVGGETIDYGPCAMLEAFDFETVYSSIDKHGRYAFGQQPNIASWNCARLAESLIALFSVEESEAVAMLSEVIAQFSQDFNLAYQNMWAKKLGLLDWRDTDSALLSELLTILNSEQLDYTNTFAALSNSLLESPYSCFAIPDVLRSWYQKWQTRIAEYDSTKVVELMCSVNPAIIPRNALVEQVISDYYQHNDSRFLKDWLPLLQQPYRYQEYEQHYLAATMDTHYKTFCGT
ncbi:protein adenylyltransferase SelO [Pseudoalteromonas sp. T1lg23B]|uniref:protein adenylyltransferase SelO n=1 Tax=Pseudoalteromonas sp. T1lg23B TaxID=2077097 RepID=UPI000CF6E621|nr:YdiU family protein [Pseudoalteromonas sp. T1lg23B]